MQNLQLSHSKKGAAPASPNAAKRLYRNLSEKFKGSHSSFEDAYFFGRSDRIRKASVSNVTWTSMNLLVVCLLLNYKLYLFVCLFEKGAAQHIESEC